MRQSETRAAHRGYNVWLYKASIFALSAAVSGFAGVLFAMAQLAAFPDVMSLHQSGYVVMMTLVGGGLVSFWGPVIGVFLFLTARDVIGALTNAWMLYFVLLFIAIVLFLYAAVRNDLSHRPSVALHPKAPEMSPPGKMNNPDAEDEDEDDDEDEDGRRIS